MKNSNTVFQVIIVVVAAIIALVMGLQLGTQDYRTVIMWFGIGAVLLYLLRGYKLTWQAILFISFLGFSMRPMGFQISTQHISFLLGVSLAVLMLFRPVMGGSRGIANSGINVAQFFCFLWIGYGGLHFLMNHFSPVYPTQWSIKYALTRYFVAFSGACLFFWYSMFPKGIVLPKGWLRTVLYLTGIALFANVLLRFYLMFGLGMELSGDRGQFYQEEGMVYIPILNILPGVEVLRLLGPLSVGLAYALLTHRGWMREQGVFTRLFVYGTLGLGFFGAAFSAGRAAVLLAIFYVMIVSVVRRKFFHIGLGVAGAMAVFIFANLNAHWVKYDAPFALSRSLQNLLVDQGGAAQASISSSNSWRKELFERGIEEWLSEDRIFWTGRATMVFNEGDSALRDVLGGFEAGIDTALRRGATHNLVTDLVVPYGIIGAILYYLFAFSLIRYLFKIQRRVRGDPELEAFAGFCLVYYCGMILYNTIGGSFFTVYEVWFTVILTIAIRARSLTESAKAKAKPVEKRRIAAGGFPQPARMR